MPQKTTIRACTVVAPNGTPFTYHFQIPGYCAKRLDFDALLLEEAIQHSAIHYFPGFGVEDIQRDGESWKIQSSQNVLGAKLIIGCDGANGVTARQLAEFELDPRHHCAAVRAYYEGVNGLQADTLEIHLLRDWLPGYFWIFPLSPTACNVGFGMLSHHVSARKVALRPALTEIIAGTAALAERFAGAHMLDKVQGFGLPLGSRWVAQSGAGFMLCGDAASLIDPATGEGIGNAMWSAQIAARWAIHAFQQGDFSASFLAGYADALKAKLHRELRQKYWVQRMVANRPWLLNGLIGRAGKRGLVNWLARKIF